MGAPDLANPEARAWIARWFTIVEDVVYMGLGVLLACTVGLLLVSSGITFYQVASSWSSTSSIVGLLEQILLIFLIVELLYTVKISFREHALLPEPFLLVGLISVIRRVLVLTAEFAKAHEAATGVQSQYVVELAVNGGLILAIAVALVLLRRRRQL